MPKKIHDPSKLKDPEVASSLAKTGKRMGIANKPIDEEYALYQIASCETIYKGNNNSLIVLGRDRPGNLYSGYGAKSATEAGRIDLIAGLRSENPNFALDSARIYMSQKADIDKYMGLAPTPRQAKPGRSTVGIKADTLRFHAREDIKIVTGRARFENTGFSGEKLSNGEVNERPGTISLIAGNYTEDEKSSLMNFLRPNKKIEGSKRKLQPIPKGDNLSECLSEIIDALKELSSIVGDNTSLIQKMDLALASHVHLVAPMPNPPFAPVALAPSTYTPITAFVQAKTISSIASRQLFNKNLELTKINYLNENFGSIYINSKHVFTT